MDFIGHFTMGFLIGTLLMTPFLRERVTYDEAEGRFVGIAFAALPEVQGRLRPHRGLTPLSQDYIPLSNNRFVQFATVVAVLCGLIAAGPDIGQLYGDSTTDESIIAETMFFHSAIDRALHEEETLWSSTYSELFLALAILLHTHLLITAWVYLQEVPLEGFNV